MHGNAARVVYLFAFNNWELFTSKVFSWFSSTKILPRGQGKKDEVFVFSLKFLLWQKHLPPVRNKISAQSWRSVLCDRSLQCPEELQAFAKEQQFPGWGLVQGTGTIMSRLFVLWAAPGNLPRILGAGLGSVIWHWPPERHMEAHYHLLTQLLFSFLMTEICTVFNANRGNTFIALSKKFWCFKAMVRKLEWLNSSVSVHPALNTLCFLLRKTSYKILPRRYFSYMYWAFTEGLQGSI